MTRRGVGRSATADDLMAMVEEFTMAVEASTAAELLVKHGLHVTGARWAEVIEPREHGEPAVLASTATPWGSSQHTNRKLREVAGDVVRTGRPPAAA